MFEGRSTSLYARLRQHGAPDYLQILKFEELEQRLNLLDFVKITEMTRYLMNCTANGLYWRPAIA